MNHRVTILLPSSYHCIIIVLSLLSKIGSLYLSINGMMENNQEGAVNS